MKQINIFLLFAFALTFFACNSDEEQLFDQAGKPTSPVLTADGASTLVIDIENDNLELYPALLNWNRANFGKGVDVTYTLEVTNDEAFTGNVQRLPLGENVYLKALSAKQLADWAFNTYGGYDAINDEYALVALYFRISAIPENWTAVNTVISNTVYIEVTGINEEPIPDPLPVPAADPTEDANEALGFAGATLFMIGSEFGGWDWSSDGIAQMAPVHSHPGHFWTIRYITAGEGFKWCPARDWNGEDFNSLGEDLGFYTKDGNAFVEQDGMYMIYVDTDAKKISVEPAQVYGIGDCFGAWDKGKFPLTVAGKAMVINTTASGNVRMYAASTIQPADVDWWQMEFVPINGHLRYRGVGNDQTAVSVDANKQVIIEFNTKRGAVK
ncbi:MAG: SusF/SusE family outer membrane protein [Candidatus Symbiothrix sp.]|jgi:hypothetical protein|nr:SusF/SusE family outer membrane protein [Candidatus Symbiothrix sp.]